MFCHLIKKVAIPDGDEKPRTQPWGSSSLGFFPLIRGCIYFKIRSAGGREKNRPWACLRGGKIDPKQVKNHEIRCFSRYFKHKSMVFRHCQSFICMLTHIYAIKSVKSGQRGNKIGKKQTLVDPGWGKKQADLKYIHPCPDARNPASLARIKRCTS